MKQEVVTNVVKCLTCQRVKAEHQRHARFLQPLEIPEWKWHSVSMEFVVGLPPTQRKNNGNHHGATHEDNPLQSNDPYISWPVPT